MSTFENFPFLKCKMCKVCLLPASLSFLQLTKECDLKREILNHIQTVKFISRFMHSLVSNIKEEPNYNQDVIIIEIVFPTFIGNVFSLLDGQGPEAKLVLPVVENNHQMTTRSKSRSDFKVARATTEEQKIFQQSAIKPGTH